MSTQQSSEYTAALSNQDRRQITLDYLRGLKPGYQEFEIFEQLARLSGLSTVELLPVRVSPQDTGKIEVLLVRRPVDDPFWPDLLHIVGAVIREDDVIEHSHDYRTAISRAMGEIGGLTFADSPVELETIHHRNVRSREIIIRFWVEVVGEPLHGEFFEVSDVLGRASELGLLDSHVAMIRRVVEAYRRAAHGANR